MKKEIVEALDHLKGYAESMVIFECLRLGILDELDHGIHVENTKKRAGSETLLKVLEFLRAADIVAMRSGVFRLTAKGKRCIQSRGYYELLVGGYRQTLAELPALIASGPQTTVRDFKWVAAGSANISHYDSIPLTLSLMRRILPKPTVIADLGCGNGEYSFLYLRALPAAIIRGCDASKEAIRDATSRIRARQLEHRISFRVCDAFEYRFGGDEDLIVLAFVLHEIAGQHGDRGLEAFLRRIRLEAPKANVIVIDVEGDPSEQQLQTKSGRGYYNLYFLLQHLTQQRLLPLQYWRQLFQRCGFRVVHLKHAQRQVDDALLEFGLLASPSLT